MSEKPTYEELEQRVHELEKVESELKTVENALQESEGKYNNIIENIEDGYYEVDIEGSFTFHNDSMCKILGYSKDELTGLNNRRYMNEENAKKVFDAFNRVYKTGQPYKAFDWELIRKNGSKCYVETSVALKRDSKGQPIGFQGIARDITERKQVEKALQKSEKRYKLLAEKSLDVIWSTNKDLKFNFVSPSVQNMFGFSPQEVIGASLLVSLPSEEKKIAKQAISKIYENARQNSFDLTSRLELRQIKKDGTVFWTEILFVPLYDESGGVIGLQGWTRNVNTRKEAQEALRESEERYRALFEYNPVDTIVVDNEAKIMMCNLIKEKTAGRKPEIGMVMYKDYAAKHQINMFEELMDSIKSGNQKEFLDLNYNERFLHIRIAPFSSGAIITSIDTTPVRKLEAQLLQSQKLESMGVLAGGIAHDFNNILTIIMGNISLAKTDLAKGDDPSELLTEAERASKRAQTLTKQLLTFAKGGAPVKETASIKDILKESSSFVLRGSKSGCEFSIKEGLWLAEIDVGQINQVISNIIINANQAMPEGGIIHVAAENLIIDNKQGFLLKPGRYIKISIKDQGVGIAKEHLLKLFDPYFTTKQEGSGLGLATTYSIIQKHDGHITVESQLGVGTTFHIYLPTSDKALPEKEEVKLIKGQGRILVMDDEAPLQKMIGRMLKNLGYESEFATNGAEAIRMVNEAKEAEKPYDAAILDLTIPGGMGGKDAIKKLLEIDPELKAIVFSGYSDDPVMANFKEYGFKGMMPKPFESRSLGKVLHEVLTGEKA